MAGAKTLKESVTRHLLVCTVLLSFPLLFILLFFGRLVPLVACYHVCQWKRGQGETDMMGGCWIEQFED